MKIRTKLITIFLMISLLPIALISFIFSGSAQKSTKESIGAGLENVTREKAYAIDLILKGFVQEAHILAATEQVKDAVQKANLSYGNKSAEDVMASILSIDEAWIEARGATETAGNIINNDLSLFFKDYKNRDESRYGEIFVTDRSGAAVAMTKVLSDYYQADESWWSGSFDKGRGRVFIDDRGFDNSIEALALGIVVPVKDGDKIAGILKINYKVRDILDIIAASRTGKSDRVFLARSRGEIIIHSEGDAPQTLSYTEKKALEGGDSGFSEDTYKGEKTIMGYSPINTEIHTRIANPEARKGISGEIWTPTTWYVFVKISQSEAFTALKMLQKWALFIGIMSALAVTMAALFLSRSMSSPILKLAEMTNAISRGRYDSRVDIRSSTEINSLAHSFNKMADDLRRVHAELREREINLKEALKLAEKKKTDMERANKSMVGRELKMIELKNEIEELKKRINTNSEQE